MGRPKPLLGWQGSTLIEYQIFQLREASCEPVIAVLGHAADQVRPAAERAGATIVVNQSYREGRASSLRAGAEAITDAEVILVASVDQPRPAKVIRRLIESHEARVTLPVHGGRRGHPVLVDGSLLAELRGADEKTQGLRAIVDRYRVCEVEFDSPVVLLDLNTPEEYEEARKTFANEVP
jgi:CTP:molybdopterin cytidylyltransferase MocA